MTLENISNEIESDNMPSKCTKLDGGSGLCFTLTDIFSFASFAHLSLAIGFLIKNYEYLIEENFLSYLTLYLGHFAIFGAMAVRIKSSFRGELTPSILGTIGHGSLLVFFLCASISAIIPSITRKTTRVTLNDHMLNLIGGVGQIGMLVIYWSEFVNKGRQLSKPMSYIYLSTYLILFLFYFVIAYKKGIDGNSYSYMFFGLSAVALLYLIFLLRRAKIFISQEEDEKKEKKIA